MLSCDALNPERPYGNMSRLVLLSLPFKATPSNLTYLQMAARGMKHELGYLKLLWCNVRKMHTAPSCLPSQLVWDHFIPKREERQKVWSHWIQVFLDGILTCCCLVCFFIWFLIFHCRCFFLRVINCTYSVPEFNLAVTQTLKKDPEHKNSPIKRWKVLEIRYSWPLLSSIS